MSNTRGIRLEGKQKLASVLVSFCTNSPAGIAVHKNVLVELVSRDFPKKGQAVISSHQLEEQPVWTMPPEARPLGSWAPDLQEVEQSPAGAAVLSLQPAQGSSEAAV